MLTQELKVKHKPPENSYRLKCFNCVTKSKFDYFITSCIIGNTIVMAMKYYTMSTSYSETLEILNYFFAGIFNLECILKLIALGNKYFYE